MSWLGDSVTSRIDGFTKVSTTVNPDEYNVPDIENEMDSSGRHSKEMKTQTFQNEVVSEEHQQQQQVYHDNDKGADDLTVLRQRLKEVESLLADETTRHRHELMTLQEMHDHQVAELQSKYNIEVTKLRQQPDTDCSSDTAREGSKDSKKHLFENQPETSVEVTRLTTVHQLENELFHAKSECHRLSTRLAVVEGEKQTTEDSCDHGLINKKEMSQSGKRQGISVSQSTLDATLTSEMQSSSYGDFTSDTKKLIGLDEGDHPSNDECCSNQGMLEHRPVKGNMEESDNEQKNKIVDVKSLTPTQLESEVYRLRSEVKLLTAMCQELEKERAGLSDELEKLKQSLQDDEGLVKNKTDDNKELETLQRRLQGLEDEVVNLIAERDTFQSSLEELDVQHQQAIDQILASRDLMQQRYKEILQENDCLLGKLKEHEEEKLTVMQLKVNVENEAKALTVSRDEWATEDAKKTSMILNVSKLVERFEDQSFVSDKDSVLDESCENEENQLLHRVALMIKSYQKIYLDNKNKDSVLQDFNRRLTQLQTSLQDKDRIIQELLISNKILEENKRPLELTIDEQRDRDLKLETTDSTDNEEISKLRAKVQALEAELKLTKESSNVQNGSLSAISAELEISGAKVQDLEIAFPSHKSDQTQKSYIENCSQTDTLPGTSIGSQVEEVAREVTEDGEVVVKFEKEVLELKQAIANLENQLLEKDRRIDSINDILHVYKENLDPDQDAIKKQQEEMVAKFETQIKALELERDRMMAILNDKARENSALKLEVHRLVNVVSAERAALGKMQRDCEEMSRTKSNVQVNSETEDMTKEAMKNLAHLVREREIEIEALRQRSATLLTLLQEQDDSAATNGSSVTDAHDRPNVTTIQTLLSERDHLKGLNERHQMEREQIINALNQKHQESVGYHAEIQRLLGMLDQVNKKYSTLEESHNSVVRQLEDQKKAAFETATEMVTLSSKTSELERNNEALRTKLDHLRLGASQPSQEESSLEGSVVATDGKDVSIIRVDAEDWKAKLQELERLNRVMQDKDKLLYEKDCVIHDKMRHVQNAKELLQRKEDELNNLKQHLDHSNNEIENCRQEIQNSRDLNTALRTRMEDLRSEIAVLKGTNSTLSVTLQEREFELKALREKVSVLGEMVEDQASRNNVGGEEEKKLKRLLSESEEMRLKAQGFQAERDQALLALAHKQRENKELMEQMKVPKEEQERLLKELDRLRTHLLQVEESYTQEALKAEEREQELRSRLARAEDRMHASASSHSAASHHAYLQVESLQEQLKTVVDQRDDILVKLSLAEDQIAQKSTALHTLQMVLEQLQQERQRDITAVHALYKDKLTQANQNSDRLLQDVNALQSRLEEANKALEAASRLSEQLDRKETTIRTLREEVQFQEAALQKAKQEIQHLTSNNEVTVDRAVMKNLMVGFLTVPKGQQKEVLKVIATVLDFNKEERDKTGVTEEKTGWISSWIPRKSSPASKTRNSHPQPQQSFTEAFVHFLESESSPRPHVKLPIESLVASRVSDRNRSPHSQQQQHLQQSDVTSVVQGKGGVSHPPINPFTYSVTTSKSESLSNPQMGTSHLLLKPMMTALPTFSPMPISEWTSSTNSVLQNVLKND